MELVRQFPHLGLADKRAVIERLVDVHPTLNLKWGEGWCYRRARRLCGQDLPQTVDELIWRKGVPAALGRANPPGFQVLYLADRVDTALQEARVVDDIAVIADFTIQKGHVIRVSPIGELAQIHRVGRGYLSGDASKGIYEMLKSCALNEARSLLIADAFLSNCLIGHDDYEISSHVALSIYKKNPGVSVIAYPSRRQAGAVNFAVRTETFWKDWALKAVRHGRACHLACGVFKLNDVKRVDGICHHGELCWSGAHEEECVIYILDPPYVHPEEKGD